MTPGRVSLGWLLGPADASAHPSRWWPALLILLHGGAYLASLFWYEQSWIVDYSSPRQLFGTAVMIVLLPTYLVWTMQLSWRKHAVELKTLADGYPEVDGVIASARQVGWWACLLVVLGLVFGFYQNLIHLNASLAQGNFFDWLFLCSNAVLWGMVALMLSWRIPISWRVGRFGRSVSVDLYQLKEAEPFARIATFDVLIVAGAVAFMPLQALDAEFRLVNYQYGVVVGLVAMVLVFVVPLWGLRQQIKAAKLDRQNELMQQLAQTSREDIRELEVLSAHLERIKSMSAWPVDITVLQRILLYVIIPPAAWVGAALVENLVDSF